jgi:UDP-GlcNAc:undecaprenyl-phosphate GlcNAc-1-phosphate transferase
MQRAQVFMGDAGSLSSGFFLAWCATSVASHNLPAVLWLMAYPLLDLTSVALRRMAAGKSPFHADRSHLHHILLDSGMQHSGMITVVLGLNVALSTVGILGLMNHIPSSVLAVGFPLLVVVYLMFTWKSVKS